MRHRKAGAKLNRTASHRKAMFRNMVTSLFKYERIKTTDTKAKELRGWAEHLITLAKRGDLHARRQALAIVREKEVVHKLFAEASEKYGSVQGGYTRVVKLGRRPGDQAPVSIIELVTPEKPKKKKATKKKAKATTPKTAGSKKSKAAAKPKKEAKTAAKADQTATQEEAQTPATDTPETAALETDAKAVAAEADAATETSDDNAVEAQTAKKEIPAQEEAPAKDKQTKKTDPDRDKETTE
jgi:large subunit ribosomal protein L17